MKLQTGTAAVGILLISTATSAWSQVNTYDTTNLREFIVRSDSLSEEVVPTSSTDEVLESIPSVQVVRRGSYAWEPVIQSYRGDQIAVTLNGMRVFGACTDKMDPVSSYTDPSSLDEVSVSCHPTGLSTGSNVGGSMNLQSARSSLKSNRFFSGRLSSGFHSVSRGGDVEGQFQLSKEKWAVKVSGAYRNREKYKDGNGQEVPYTQYNKYNWAVNARYQLSKKTFLEADYLQDVGRNIGYAGLPMDVSLAKADLYSLAIKHYNVGKILESVEWKIYGNEVVHDMDDSNRPDEEVPIRMDMPGWSRTYGSFAHLKGKNWNRHQLEARLEYYQNFRRAEMTMYAPGEKPMFMLTWPDVFRKVWGGALADRWRWTDQDYLEISARYEFIQSEVQDEFGHQEWEIFGYNTDSVYRHQPFQASLTWNRNWGKKWSTWIGGGFAQRAPGTTELFGYYLFSREDGYDYLGNPNLRMESAWKAYAGLKRVTANMKWELNLSYDYLVDYIFGETDTLLSGMTVGSNGVKVFTNLPYAQTMGASLNGEGKLYQNFQWTTRLGYVLGLKNDGSYLPQIPPFHYRLGVKWRKKKGFANVELQGATRQGHIDPGFGEDETPSWAIVNLGGGYELFRKGNSRLNLEAQVSNLFDSYYFEHLDWGNVPRPGRNFSLSAVWRF
ncbi:hypothetical protein KFE98_14350 [bacterium SCSIO 12741]|nr:hypothetical protein KFE98_14350 [bacterium SCSIO 12741]